MLDRFRETSRGLVGGSGSAGRVVKLAEVEVFPLISPSIAQYLIAYIDPEI